MVSAADRLRVGQPGLPVDNDRERSLWEVRTLVPPRWLRRAFGPAARFLIIVRHPLACALEVMENVSKCYVHDNPIQQNELYWLESKGNGGTDSHKLPFYELFSGHS